MRPSLEIRIGAAAQREGPEPAHRQGLCDRSGSHGQSQKPHEEPQLTKKGKQTRKDKLTFKHEARGETQIYPDPKTAGPSWSWTEGELPGGGPGAAG